MSSRPLTARIITAIFCACLSCACTVAPPPAAPAPATSRAAPPVAPARTLLAEDDWRSLLPVALGSPVAQVPFALKEVLLFQGAVPAGEPRAEAEEPECYSGAERQFRLRGVPADDYVLCFSHDRLFRAEAVLRLPKDFALETFPGWCEEWLAGLADTERSAERCAGREGDTLFEATLTYDTELAGPLVTLAVTDARAREFLDQHRNERPEKNPPPSGS